MSHRLAPRRVLVAAAVAAATLSGAPAGVAGPPLPGEPDSCRVVAFSPQVQTDRTAICVGYLVDRTYELHQFTLSLLVYSSRDAGRTWLPAAGAGLLADDGTHLGGVAFSPAYAVDRTVFLQTTTQGVMASSDLGNTWTPVDEHATAWADDFRVAPSMLPTQLEPLRSAAAVTVGGEARDSMTISQSLVSAPAIGSPGDDRRLLVPDGFPSRPAYAFADVKVEDGNSTKRRAALFECDVKLTCDRLLHQWPMGTAAELAWLSPNFAKDRTIYLTVRTAAAKQPLQAWVSKNAGATFARWSSVDKLLRVPNQVSGDNTAVGLAMAAGTNRFYLRVVSDGLWPTKYGTTTPIQSVYRSDDRGGRWKRVAVSEVDYNTLKPRGNLPFYLRHGIDRRQVGDLWMLRDGRVFATGGYVDIEPKTGLYAEYYGMWCSTDGGGTWTRRCAK